MSEIKLLPAAIFIWIAAKSKIAALAIMIIFIWLLLLLTVTVPPYAADEFPETKNFLMRPLQPALNYLKNYKGTNETKNQDRNHNNQKKLDENINRRRK